MPAEPGPFGWAANLFRWHTSDVKYGGQGGVLPPPKARSVDPTEGDLYQGLADGWLHGTVGAALSSFFSEPRTRKELYVLFEKMDMTDMAGGFLDQLAEDATQEDQETKLALWVTGPDAIVERLMDMHADLRTQEEILPLTRELAKFGDDFERLVYRSGINGGVKRMLPTPPLSITRKEDKEARLLGYNQTGKRFRNDNNETSYPWDFAHWRIRGRDRRYPYGTSVLHNAIRPWKQLIILDDWMLGYQIAKHPDRNLILLDIGSASDVEAGDVGRKFRQKLRRHVLIDPAGMSGRNMNYRVDPISPMEDMILPVRPNSGTTVQKLSGSANAVDMLPIHLKMKQFYSAVRAPIAFFDLDPTQGGQPLNMKASLVNQDVRYARRVRYVQKCVRKGYRFLSEFHLMLLMSPSDRAEDKDVTAAIRQQLDWRLPENDFEIHMAPISFLEELERLEVMQTRQQVAMVMMELSRDNPAFDSFNWTRYIMSEIIKIPDQQLEELIRQDIDQVGVDNIKAGLLPSGKHPDSAKKESRLILTPAQLREARQADGNISEAEKKLLAEAIRRDAKLRHLINLGTHIFREEACEETLGHPILPDTNNELFRKGLLTDCITEDVLQQILEESRRELRVVTPEVDDA